MAWMNTCVGDWLTDITNKTRSERIDKNNNTILLM